MISYVCSNIKNKQLLFEENIILINREYRIAKKYIHKLELTGTENVKSKSYPNPYKYKNYVENTINTMLKDNAIERCNSKYINPQQS